MKNEIRLALLCLSVASVPAIAQNTTDSRCGTTNYDRSRNMFTIVNPTPGLANQQCFIDVVSKESWSGGMPDMASSQLVEGNYEITLSGAGGAGGGGGAGKDSRRGDAEGGGGSGGGGGSSALPNTTVRYLTPGVYRMTIGAGGQSGPSNGGHGGDGAPTSFSNAYSGETVAGFSRAENWDGTYPLVAQAYVGSPAKTGEHGADGGTGTSAQSAGDSGNQGGSGFITLALKDPVPQAAPMKAAPDTSSASQSDTTPDRTANRPAKKDRN